MLFIFHPSYGVLPYVLSFVTAYHFNWLLKGWVAMTLIIVATVWTLFGYNIAFFLRVFAAIPTSVLEAASVEGAGPVRRFRRHRLPAALADHVLSRRRQPDFAFFDAFGVIHS